MMVSTPLIGAWETNGVWVVPLADLREHDRDNADCACDPFFDGDVLVHNSFDWREAFERGERKAS